MAKWDNRDLAATIERDKKLRHYELPPEEGQDPKDKQERPGHGQGGTPEGEDTIEYEHDPRTQTTLVRVKTALGARASGRVEDRHHSEETRALAEALGRQLLKALHAAARGGKGDGKGEGEGGEEGDGDSSKESKEKRQGKGKGKGKGQSQEDWFEALKKALTGIMIAHGYKEAV